MWWWLLCMYVRFSHIAMDCITSACFWRDVRPSNRATSRYLDTTELMCASASMSFTPKRCSSDMRWSSTRTSSGVKLRAAARSADTPWSRFNSNCGTKRKKHQSKMSHPHMSAPSQTANSDHCIPGWICTKNDLLINSGTFVPAANSHAIHRSLSWRT